MNNAPPSSVCTIRLSLRCRAHTSSYLTRREVDPEKDELARQERERRREADRSRSRSVSVQPLRDFEPRTEEPTPRSTTPVPVDDVLTGANGGSIEMAAVPPNLELEEVDWAEVDREVEEALAEDGDDGENEMDSTVDGESDEM